MKRTLVAGVGNVFLHDDAFGVEVAKALTARREGRPGGRPGRPGGRAPADGVEIGDFGIRGVHLVYELLDGCDLFVLVDAAQRGCAPGTVTVVDVGPGDAAPRAPVGDTAVGDTAGGGAAGGGAADRDTAVGSAGDAGAAGGRPLMDAHGLAPDDVFAMLAALGGRPGRSLLVACEPADLSPGMGLSAPVAAAVPHAVRAVEEIIGEEG